MASDPVEDFSDRTDDELYEILGAILQGSGLGVSPTELARFRRFARKWFDNKLHQFWQRVRGSETYRIWLESAGTDQVVDPDTVSEILREQDWEPDASAVLAELMVRAETAVVAETYDIAMSCAAEQRGYVERCVRAARSLTLHVFYDKDMSNAWWGRNFVVERRKVYGQFTLHFVPFISNEYLLKPGPRDDFAFAMVRAIQHEDRYILPVLVGAVTVPHELLNPHIGYLRADEYAPEELAAHMKLVVDQSRMSGRKPRDFGDIVHGAHRREGGVR